MRAPPSGRALVLAFVTLLILAGGSWGAAALGTGTAIAITIAALKAVTIALVFMELGRAHDADRAIAAVAVFCVVLLCLGAVADVAFR